MRQIVSGLLGYWSTFVNTLLPDRKQRKQWSIRLGEINENRQSQLIANLHYSIPGKALAGSIDNGHVVKTENKWPLSGN